MNWEEIFVFSKIFSKTPPKNRFPFQTSEGANFLKEIFEKSVNLGVHFYTLCPNEWKEFFLWQDYQRNWNRNGIFLSVPKQAEEHTTTCAVNVGRIANKVFEQSLSVVLCIVLKEASNLHQTATFLTIRDKRITDICFKIKRLTERIFDDFGSFSIQKKCCRVIILARRSKQFKYQVTV